MYAMVYETPEDLLEQWQAIGRGELTEKYGFNCCFPSVHDPSQAPPGRHTGLISMMAPFKLQEGAEKWYDRKTPIEGLYVCGASSHSGGFITFGPGYYAVNAIVADLGIEKWWSEPELITEYRKKGYA